MRTASMNCLTSPPPPPSSSSPQANSAYRKYELPDRLTPEMIKSLLTEMRGDAIKRNIIKQPVRGGDVRMRQQDIASQ